MLKWISLNTPNLGNKGYHENMYHNITTKLQISTSTTCSQFLMIYNLQPVHEVQQLTASFWGSPTVSEDLQLTAIFWGSTTVSEDLQLAARFWGSQYKTRIQEYIRDNFYLAEISANPDASNFLLL